MNIHLPMMNKTKRNEFVILGLCLIMGFALRFYTFDQKSLWVDEIHTFNDSRDGLNGQISFYKQNPTYLHPPMFFILTHLFYPFTKPERDLRIIPLVFGTLSIPLFYFLAKSFSSNIALSSTLSLIFMTYHIYLSQDGRAYSLLMFLGMAGLYFFVKYLKTLRKKNLFFVAISFALLFYTSYSAIPFIALSQILWFYKIREDDKKSKVSSFFILNSLIFLFCLPWILFVALNYQGHPIMDPLHTETPGTIWTILYGIIQDWAPHKPLIIVSELLLIIFPFFPRFRKNALILLGVFFLPVGSLYLFCRFFKVTHFFTSRYFINFLPLFLITLFLSLNAIEFEFRRLKKRVRPMFLFLILFIASNLVILPLYYRSEKQDFRGLVTYIRSQLKDGDKIFVAMKAYLPGIYHYFGLYPEGRAYVVPIGEGSKGIEYRMALFDGNNQFTIYHSNTCCTQYVTDGSRVWIIADKWTAKNRFGKDSPFVFKGHFDGSFANFRKFPTDASMYLFLWDPKSQEEKRIDIPIE